MYQRHSYVDSAKAQWTDIKDPVATKKWDGSHFYMVVEPDGSLRYYSRRQSVKGHFPERTAQLPQLTEKKLPHLAGNVYSVELIHTGKNKDTSESHSAASGILNSLPPRAIETQKTTGPIRAVLLDVINPPLNTYREKLLHMKEVEQAYDKPSVMFVSKPEITTKGISKLIEDTKNKQEEGVIVTSLDTPEDQNKRVKIKHFMTHNLKVTGMREEYDIHGKPKGSMGALELTDKSGKDVGLVGTGFTRAQRIDAWKNPKAWLEKLVQVKSMGIGNQGKLRHPVWNGDADGELDRVE